MTRKFVLGFTTLILSCSSPYKYWDISKFNMVSNALADNEEIKLIYSSRAPNNNKNLDCYIQVVVVSQKSNDTVNILTPIDNGFSMNDEDKVFNYFDLNNVAAKLILTDPEKLKDIENVNEASKNVPKKITKVARDPKFDNIADNHHPTVIGVIGTTSK